MRQINPLVYHALNQDSLLPSPYRFIGFYQACISLCEDSNRTIYVLIKKGKSLSISPRIPVKAIIAPLSGSTFHVPYLRSLISEEVDERLCEEERCNEMLSSKELAEPLKGLIAIIYPSNTQYNSMSSTTSRRTGILYGIFGLDRDFGFRNMSLLLTRYSERVGYSRIYVLLLLPTSYTEHLRARLEKSLYKLKII